MAGAGWPRWKTVFVNIGTQKRLSGEHSSPSLYRDGAPFSIMYGGGNRLGRLGALSGSMGKLPIHCSTSFSVITRPLGH